MRRDKPWFSSLDEAKRLVAVPGTLLSLEGKTPDGTVQLEREFVYYGKIVDIADLASASEHEEQEQWELRVPRSENSLYFGSIRVRRSVYSRDPETAHYVLTMKSLKDDVSGKDEVELPATEGMFEMIKRLATGGSIKTRYLFPIEGTDYKWEVDVYATNGEGGLSDWCKIDLEVDDPDYQPPDFPIQMTEVIKNQPADRTDDERALVEKLMSEQFILSNPYPKRPSS